MIIEEFFCEKKQLVGVMQLYETICPSYAVSVFYTRGFTPQVHMYNS